MIRRMIMFSYHADYDPTIRTPGPIVRAKDEDHYDCACYKSFKAEPGAMAPVQSSSRPPYVADPLTVHASMYVLGDKYQIDGLCELALDKFYSCLRNHWNSEDFIDAVRVAYTSTPNTDRGLRNAIIAAFKIYFKVDLLELPGVEKNLSSIDKLSFLLLKAWPNKVRGGPDSPDDYDYSDSF